MSISLSLRKRIASFDPVRDGKTVRQFCREVGCSRQTYYNIKKRVKERGEAGIIPDSTAPHTPHTRFDDDDHRLILETRERLKKFGADYGSWSIYYALVDENNRLDGPSRSTIARVLSVHGVTEENARKRPRSSLKRFARGAANELWQIDAMIYRLFDLHHTQITIYQVIDDATRLDVGTQAFATHENGTDARTVRSSPGWWCICLSFQLEDFAAAHSCSTGQGYQLDTHAAISVFVAGLPSITFWLIIVRVWARLVSDI